MNKESAQNTAEKSKEESLNEELQSQESSKQKDIPQEDPSDTIEVNNEKETNLEDSPEDGQEEALDGTMDNAEDIGGEEEPETMESLKARHKNELAEKNEKYMRLAAEFENFKKRSNQEMQTRFKFASQSLALNIISGLDNLERALEQAKEEENEQLKEFVRGIEMVQQQLYEALEKNNIERIYPKGEQFDPNHHEAMGIIETEEVEPDHIAEVFQAGYILHDRVIRPAMVQVAKKK